MTDTILPLSGATPSSSALLPAGESIAASEASALTSDFETFLLMLTTQAENQDPLEPIDSSEYAAQLAQFSMVEQQVLTNENLSALAAQLNLQNAANLATWVGMEVRAETTARFDGTPVTIVPKFEPGAESAYLVVRNAQDEEVARKPIEVSSTPIEWDGTDNAGSVLPDGDYRLVVDSYSNDQVTGTLQAEVYARVTEAQISGSNVQLVLSNGKSVPSSTVSAIRE